MYKAKTPSTWKYFFSNIPYLGLSLFYNWAKEGNCLGAGENLTSNLIFGLLKEKQKVEKKEVSQSAPHKTHILPKVLVLTNDDFDKTGR